jgi:hypothetical protein
VIEVIPTGRYRYYRLRGPDVARLVEVIGRLAPAQPVRSLREGTRAHALRLARRCYDHIAGRLGVAITDALREHGLVDGPDGIPGLGAVRGDRLAGGATEEVDYRLTAKGRRQLTVIGGPYRAGWVRCVAASTGPSSATTSPARLAPRFWTPSTPPAGSRLQRVTAL